MLDLSELPETYGKDEVGILSKDPLWYFVYWEVTAAGEAAAREQLGPSGEAARLVLRLFITIGGGPLPGGAASGHGLSYGREIRELRDVTLPHLHGRKYLEAPRPGALLRAAVGVLSVEGYFAPIAHSAPVRMPPQQAAPQTSAEWLHVMPTRSEGQQRERIIAVPPSAPHVEQLLPVPGPAGRTGDPGALFPATPDADPGSSAAQAKRDAGGGKSPGPGLGRGSGGLG
jgi:hypothetical protein